MGDMELNSVTVETLEDFRLHLVQERKLTLKTARNIIDGSLRAMFRDAGRRVGRNPFNDLPANWWRRLPKKEPDPYTKMSAVGFSISAGSATLQRIRFRLLQVLYRHEAKRGIGAEVGEC